MCYCLQWTSMPSFLKHLKILLHLFACSILCGGVCHGTNKKVERVWSFSSTMWVLGSKLVVRLGRLVLYSLSRLPGTLYRPFRFYLYCVHECFVCIFVPELCARLVFIEGNSRGITDVSNHVGANNQTWVLLRALNQPLSYFSSPPFFIYLRLGLVNLRLALNLLYSQR